MRFRRKGFTLIELLVVIAIIGILAAMLFPVFARARESARKIQCLSNVKNIALAMQMYFTDYDAFIPVETRQDVAAFLDTQPGGGDRCFDMSPSIPASTDSLKFATLINPYLQLPVILDEYIKNRDVWRCPSAKYDQSPTMIFGNPDWLAELQATSGQWGYDADIRPCEPMYPYPNGWGGTVTDSIKQQQTTGQGAFVMSLGSPLTEGYGMKLSEIGDPSAYLVVTEYGVNTPFNPSLVAYPEICGAECNGVQACGYVTTPGNCCLDNTGGDPDCDAVANSLATYEFYHNPSIRENYARHLGGVNIGYADGHAKWLKSQQVYTDFVAGKLTGIRTPCGGRGQYAIYLQKCGTPSSDQVFLY